MAVARLSLRLAPSPSRALWPRLRTRLPTIDLYRERAARPIPVVRIAAPR